MELSPYSFEKGIKPAGDSKEAKAAAKETERSVQTVFRIVSGNHLRLSVMADNKAHIMIQVNAIIISIMFSVLLGRLEYYPHLVIPTLILAVTSVLTIVFSVLATRPTITAGRFTEDDIRQKKTNLMFFGNFYKMEVNVISLWRVFEGEEAILRSLRKSSSRGRFQATRKAGQ